MERIPPHSLDHEKALLGALLLQPETYDDALASLGGSESFYTPQHTLIFETIGEIREAGKPVEWLSVRDALASKHKLEEVGGLAYLVELSESFADPSNVAFYATEIREHWKRRQLILAGMRLVDQGYDVFSEPDAIAAQHCTDLERNVIALSENAVFTVQELLADAEAEMGEASTFLPTGLTRFDRVLGGIPRGALTIVGAARSVGKTAFGMQLCFAAAKAGIAAILYSVEMSKRAIQQRLVGMLAAHSFKFLRTQSPSERRFYMQFANDNAPDMPPVRIATGLTWLHEIVASVKSLRRRHNIAVVVVDYMQLVRLKGKYETRNLEISHVSKTLKALASEDMAVIVLAQVNRDAARSGKPELHHLRDSGTIEEDADNVVLLWRPEIAGHTIDDRRAQVDVNWKVAKQRNGPIGEGRFSFDVRTTTFMQHPMEVDDDDGKTEELNRNGRGLAGVFVSSAAALDTRASSGLGGSNRADDTATEGGYAEKDIPF